MSVASHYIVVSQYNDYIRTLDFEPRRKLKDPEIFNDAVIPNPGLGIPGQNDLPRLSVTIEDVSLETPPSYHMR